MSTRTVRTSPVTGMRIDPILTAAIVSELLAPSEELWIVSPWISDVAVLDNSAGEFDALFPEPSPSAYPLSAVLSAIVSQGTNLCVVARPVDHNAPFLDALRRSTATERLRVVLHEDLHEKTMCGQSWVLSGSMNFTVRGLNVNDEAVRYDVDAAAAAQARLDFARRWGRPS